MSKTYYYARVSTREQNLARQIKAIEEHAHKTRAELEKLELLFTDKQSGRNLDREGYKALKGAIKKGDTLVVKSVDRLSRTKKDATAELRYYQTQGIRVVILDIPTTTKDFGDDLITQMINNILIEVYTTIAEQEVRTKAQRQAEGVAAMEVEDDSYNERGRLEGYGRPKASVSDDWQEIYSRYRAGEISAKDAQEQAGVTKSKFYRLLDDEARAYIRANNIDFNGSRSDADTLIQMGITSEQFYKLKKQMRDDDARKADRKAQAKKTLSK